MEKNPNATESSSGDPRGGLPLSAGEATTVRVLRRSQFLERSESQQLYRANERGWMRTKFPGLNASRCMTGFVFVPVGQGSPRHITPALQHIVTLTEGAVQYDFGPGKERIYLDVMDQIFIPGNVEYSYRNVAMRDTWLFNLVTAADWPPPVDRVKFPDDRR
jgi:quercetin dioxygenase-like cupin family protein